jgi:hypothetical protein
LSKRVKCISEKLKLFKKFKSFNGFNLIISRRIQRFPQVVFDFFDRGSRLENLGERAETSGEAVQKLKSFKPFISLAAINEFTATKITGSTPTAVSTSRLFPGY